MKKLNLIKWPLLGLLCYSTLNCTPKPPDVYVFEHLGQHLSTDPVNGHLILTPSPTCMKMINEAECGHGVTIVTGKEIFIGEEQTHLFNGKQWSKIRQEAVYLPAAESYAPIAAYMINSCKKMGCNDDLTRFKVKIDSLKGVTEVVNSLIEQTPP